MFFAPMNFIEAGWKDKRLVVRSSFWWSEAARSRNKQASYTVRQKRSFGHVREKLDHFLEHMRFRVPVVRLLKYCLKYFIY
jgi:hypothetical protein